MSASGRKANKYGKTLEKQVQHLIEGKGYTYFPQNRIEAATILERPFYTRQFSIPKNLYEGKKTKTDFLLYHPQKHPEFLIIECKWQQTGGSVDEKYPYLVLNIRQNYPYDTMIVIDGGGYSEGAIKWLKKQKRGKIKEVCTMAKFMKLANDDFI